MLETSQGETCQRHHRVRQMSETSQGETDVRDITGWDGHQRQQTAIKHIIHQASSHTITNAHKRYVQNLLHQISPQLDYKCAEKFIYIPK